MFAKDGGVDPDVNDASQLATEIFQIESLRDWESTIENEIRVNRTGKLFRVRCYGGYGRKSESKWENWQMFGLVECLKGRR